jgi:hypothetical protein
MNNIYYEIAAYLVIILHLSFVCFVILGGLLVLKWRRVVFLHIPAVIWGALIELQGRVCPLTPLEQYFMKMANQGGYTGGFIEHYLLSILYPSNLTREIQVMLGVFVIVLNLVIYGWLAARLIRSKSKAG